MDKKIICPVCGIVDAVDELPWDENSNASQDICPCCGTHYGEDDWAESMDQIKEEHIKLRQKWIQEGMKWWSKDDEYHPEPKNWDPKEQLRNIPKEFLGPNEHY